MIKAMIKALLLLFILLITPTAVFSSIAPVLSPGVNVPFNGPESSSCIVGTNCLIVDGYTAGDGAITSGAGHNFSSASRNCTSADAGKELIVAGAGASSAPFKTTVSSCSGNNYVPAANASTTVSSAQWSIGTDNSAALCSAATAAVGGTLYLPPGQILFDATQCTLNNVHLIGAGILADRTASFGNNANYGTTLLMVSTSVQPFIIETSVTVDGVNFFWPGQAGVTSTPVTYPPLYTDNGSTQLSDFTVINGSVINAYDFLTQSSSAPTYGGIRISDSNIYAIHRPFSLTSIGETVSIHNDIFNPSIYASATLSGNEYLGIWTQNNGEFIYIFGGGAASSSCAGNTAGGIKVNGFTTVVGYNIGVHVVSGVLDEFQATSSSDWNGMGQILKVEAAGAITRGFFDGVYYPNGTYGITNSNPAFQDDSTCTTAGGGQNFAIKGAVVGATAGIVELSGVIGDFSIDGLQAYNYAGIASGGPYYLVNINATSVRASIKGVNAYPQHTGSNYTGINIVSATMVIIEDNTFLNVYVPVNLNSSTARIMISGNASVDTGGTYSLAASPSTNTATVAPSTVNNWDKQNPLW